LRGKGKRETKNLRLKVDGTAGEKVTAKRGCVKSLGQG